MSDCDDKFLFLVHILTPGIADIIGRRFGKKKIPYNHDKSFAGSIAMGTTGFIVSVW